MTSTSNDFESVANDPYDIASHSTNSHIIPHEGLQITNGFVLPMPPSSLEVLLFQIRTCTIASSATTESALTTSFWKHIRAGVYFLKVNSPHLAWPALSSACSQVRFLFEQGEANLGLPFLRNLFATLSPANMVLHPETRKLLLRHLSNFMSFNHHPLAGICKHLAKDEIEDNAYQAALEYLFHESQSTDLSYQFSPEEVFKLQRNIVRVHRYSSSLSTAETRGKWLIQYATYQFSPLSFETTEAMRELMRVYAIQGRYADGIILGEEAHLIKTKSLGADYPDYAGCYIMESIAELHYLSGSFEQSLIWMRQALNGQWNLRGGVAQTVHVRDKLVATMELLGMADEVPAILEQYSGESDDSVD
jgi:hypothetical protein